MSGWPCRSVSTVSPSITFGNVKGTTWVESKHRWRHYSDFSNLARTQFDVCMKKKTKKISGGQFERRFGKNGGDLISHRCDEPTAFPIFIVILVCVLSC